MLDWLKNIRKEYPEFWKNYLEKFDDKPNRYVALSVETTGINPKKDSIISFGAVAIQDNKIIISDSFEIAINEHENTEQAVIQKFIDYIGNAIVVGHRLHLDVEIINEILDKIECGRLKNEVLDVEVMHKRVHDIHDDKPLSLKEITAYYKVEQSDRISTSEDAFSIALLFLKLKSHLKLNN